MNKQNVSKCSYRSPNTSTDLVYNTYNGVGMQLVLPDGGVLYKGDIEASCGRLFKHTFRYCLCLTPLE